MVHRQHDSAIHDIVKGKLGHRELRPGQKEALEAVLAGRDTLAVLPTGSGKSAIYQVAAQMIAGPTVVVSPLIALQKDQVASIAERDLGGAAVVNSTLTDANKQELLDEVGDHRVEFLLLAPEQLTVQETLERVKAAKPSLFVVDEAHCVSEWGHDFRPDYLRLGAVIEELGHPRILALTATAAPKVREEIVSRLGMRDPVVVVRDFDRPNIWLGVESFESEHDKLRTLILRVEREPKPGIVYAATRKNAESIASALAEKGVRAAAYHAGLPKKERDLRQNAFMDDQLDVIVATTAFGMGIDKPNVRFVFHHDPSESLDAYYQEIGRAGRDGRPARAIIFYRQEDLGLRRFFKAAGKLDRGDVQRVIETVAKDSGPIEPERIREETGVSPGKIENAVTRLEESGILSRQATGEVSTRTPPGSAETIERAADEAVKSQEARREAEQLRVEQMRAYAELRDCRRAYLLEHFGGESRGPCERCDNCERADAHPQEAAQERASGEPFPLKTRVVHKQWGKGIVVGYEGSEHDKVVVLFDDVGYKRLATDLCRSRGLLSPS